MDFCRAKKSRFFSNWQRICHAILQWIFNAILSFLHKRTKSEKRRNSCAAKRRSAADKHHSSLSSFNQQANPITQHPLQHTYCLNASRLVKSQCDDLIISNSRPVFFFYLSVQLSVFWCIIPPSARCVRFNVQTLHADADKASTSVKGTFLFDASRSVHRKQY